MRANVENCLSGKMNVKMNFLVHLLLLIAVRSNLVRGISTNDFYSHINEPSEILARGDEVSEKIQLTHPVHFYGDTYDDVYVSAAEGVLKKGRSEMRVIFCR